MIGRGRFVSCRSVTAATRPVRSADPIKDGSVEFIICGRARAWAILMEVVQHRKQDHLLFVVSQWLENYAVQVIPELTKSMHRVSRNIIADSLAD